MKSKEQKTIIFSFVIIILLSFNCGNKKQISKTDSFNNYLKKYYNLTIPQIEHGFLIITINEGCPSCSKSILKRLEYNSDKFKNLTVIISDKNINRNYNEYLKKFKNNYYKFDTTENINRLNLGLFGSGIIYTNNCKIDSTCRINLSNGKSILPVLCNA